MSIQRRYILGSLISATAVGAALALDLMGPVKKPDPLVLQFARGAVLATGEDARLAVFIGDSLSEDRLNFHILGHSGTRGDAQANVSLAQDRADMVASALIEGGVPPERVLSVKGVGAADALARAPEESDAQHQRRMARVVITSVVRK